MNVLLYTVGTMPCLEWCLKALTRFNSASRIHLIGHGLSQEHVDDQPYRARADRFNALYEHHSDNAERFERWCLERWLVMGDYARALGLKEYFTLDHDVLVFCDLDETARTYGCCDYTWPMYGACFVFRPEATYEFGEFVLRYFSSPSPLRDQLQGQFATQRIGVSDMQLSNAFSADRATVSSIDPNLGPIFDTNLCLAQGCVTDAQGIKRLAFVNGIPWATKTDGQRIRLLGLHCWGAARAKMEDYLQAAEASIHSLH